jgi:hypothetical protein
MVSQDKGTTSDTPVNLTPAQQMVAAVAAARRDGKVTSADVSEYDQDGFKMVLNKDWLVGRGFVMVNAEFGVGEYGDQVIITGVTNAGVPFKMRDSSTGIYNQLTGMTNVQYPVEFPRGLRASTYEKNGRSVTTYYFADKD